MSSQKILSKIETRISELEALLKSGNYEEAQNLIPNITKFVSILTAEQRDIINAAKYAICHNIPWK